jgi:hypothetical protein
MVKVFLLVIALGALATPARAQSRQVIGYAGALGEWELTAVVTNLASRRVGEFTGPLMMRHVGICTQDGAEERTGEIRLRLSTGSHRLKATLLIAGVECTYSGRWADSYEGVMTCPDARPVPLTLWLK